jgi:hypothetical protein
VRGCGQRDSKETGKRRSNQDAAEARGRRGGGLGGGGGHMRDKVNRVRAVRAKAMGGKSKKSSRGDGRDGGGGGQGEAEGEGAIAVLEGVARNSGTLKRWRGGRANCGSEATEASSASPLRTRCTCVTTPHAMHVRASRMWCACMSVRWCLEGVQGQLIFSLPPHTRARC